MKIYSLFRVYTVLTLLAVSFLSFVSTVSAKGTATVGTTLTFEPLAPVSVGSPSFVLLKLVSSKGEPVVNQSIELFVDGVRLRRARTDDAGIAAMRVTRDVAGTYTLSATFKGSKLPSLGSSKATAELVVTPALVEVIVTPPLPDIRFSLDGRIFTSDDYGVARIKVKEAGNYQIDVLPLEVKDEDIRMQFGRWGDDEFQPTRQIEVPLKKPLQVGFEVSYQVSQKFVDLSDQPVDSSRITSITYKGSNGATFTFEDTGAHWLPAGRVIRLNNGLQETKILYSVINIVIDGANVVSKAQQRFYVNPSDEWTIQVLLYSAQFTARDALFGFPIGTGIEMEYPDGEVQSYSFDPEKGYTIDGLARGIYRVTVTGAQGFAPPTPIALSRNQDVELMVFSYIDMGVLASIGLILSVGLLLFGRPYLFTQALGSISRLIPKRRGLQPAGVHKAVGTRARLWPWKRTVLPDSQPTDMEDSPSAVEDLTSYAEVAAESDLAQQKKKIESLV